MDPILFKKNELGRIRALNESEIDLISGATTDQELDYGNCTQWTTRWTDNSGGTTTAQNDLDGRDYDGSNCDATVV